MTPLGLFVLVGMPVSVVLLGWAAMWLNERALTQGSVSDAGRSTQSLASVSAAEQDGTDAEAAHQLLKTKTIHGPPAVAKRFDAFGPMAEQILPYEGPAERVFGPIHVPIKTKEGESEEFKQAIAAFRLALQEQTRNKGPLDWAVCQSNLGTALLRLGEREGGTESIEQAVVAYRLALEEQTRERVPLDWAATQRNLGIALLRLGERRQAEEVVTDAVADAGIEPVQPG